MEATKPRSVDEYRIGWICALPTVWIAASGMLYETHPNIEKPSNDSNNYTLGCIYGHNIVIACPPNEEIGNNSTAAIVAARMLSTFPQIRIVLLVGIGSGVPPKVSLGDVVVSTSVEKEPGLVQWGTGKDKGNGSFERIGSLKQPSGSLLQAVKDAKAERNWHAARVYSDFENLREKWPKLVSKYLRSDSVEDILILAKTDYGDVNKSTTGDIDDGEEEENRRCCGRAMNVKMEPEEVRMHFGMIASGNQVIEDAELRDKLNKDLGGNVLCVETEAAGLAEIVPCLVIRGICDYADSHKNKDWQEHAAAMAAVVAKEIVMCLPDDIEHEPLAMDVIDKVFIGSARNDSPQPIVADADRELQRFGLTLSLAQMLQDKQQIDKTQQLRSQKTLN
ncbi:hypothetical protein TsFJ059_002297 [Trichoderma semiorbis]|uniref:Nucleoside phosphorylase domain-containing protein n=1 Tax=Trichoderma semiorbis TaxID=1491008 RepID=A0A9P8HLZ7_9HYPO|nr:hypothetical protein TsFJ059_002297 [Trichoderma semiorbis]